MTEPLDCAGGKMPFKLNTHIYWYFRQAYEGRPYHNFTHIEEMLDEYSKVDLLGLWQKPVEVAFAILFHDIVYIPGAKDNEAKSSEEARNTIPRFYPNLKVDLDIVTTLIAMTADHGKWNASTLTSDAQLFLDCDMAILAAEPERFIDYDKAIAEEYSAVPADLYTAGRKRFFQHLLDSDSIFLSEHFRQQLEIKARNNIAFALNNVECFSVSKP